MEMVGNLVKVKEKTTDSQIISFFLEKNKLTRIRTKDIHLYKLLLKSILNKNNFLDLVEEKHYLFNLKSVSSYISDNGNDKFLSLLPSNLLEKKMYNISNNEYKIIKSISLFSKEKNIVIGTGGFSIIELNLFYSVLNLALKDKKTTCLEITYPFIKDHKLDSMLDIPIKDISQPIL